jgi:tellurite resistance protein TerA
MSSTQGGGVSLNKVTLTKAKPTVSLAKPASAGGLLRVNLNWNARPVAKGLFRRSEPSIDLDLGALYEYTDGSKGAVQALGNGFQDKHGFGGGPIVRLDADDRSGTSTDGENLFIDLGRLDRIRRVLVYAFIYEGAPNWAAADGVVTIFPAAGPAIEVRLDESTPGRSMCGIALLENSGGDLSIRREVRYVGGHRDLDDAFGWGLQWEAGRK